MLIKSGTNLIVRLKHIRKLYMKRIKLMLDVVRSYLKASRL